MNKMYAIKTVDNKIAMDTRTGQLEIYETFDYAYNAICRELDTVVEIEYFKTKEGAKRDLEQQAKGIEDALNDYDVSLELLAGDKFYKKALTNRVRKLREQAKQLKGGAE